jgi:hypothetical protein
MDSRVFHLVKPMSSSLPLLRINRSTPLNFQSISPNTPSGASHLGSFDSLWRS